MTDKEELLLYRLWEFVKLADPYMFNSNVSHDQLRSGLRQPWEIMRTAMCEVEAERIMQEKKEKLTDNIHRGIEGKHIGGIEETIEAKALRKKPYPR